MPTIGVAVAIPEPWATQLQDYRTSVGDTTATMIPTPHHAGAADRGRRGRPGRAREAPGEPRPRPARFGVHLRGTGTFRPVSPVVFVTLVEGISQCEQLAAAVRRGPLDVELQFPYHPHVTIAHHLADDAAGPRVRRARRLRVRVRRRGVPPLRPRRGEPGWQPTRDFPLQPMPAVS